MDEASMDYYSQHHEIFPEAYKWAIQYLMAILNQITSGNSYRDFKTEKLMLSKI